MANKPVDGTRLDLLLQAWAEEDRLMSELYDSITFENAVQILKEEFPQLQAGEVSKDTKQE